MSARRKVVEITESTPITAAGGAQKCTPGGTPPKKGRKKKRSASPLHLQEAEVDRLFRVITDPRDRAIFRVAYHGGLRASEIGLLEMRDYDAKTGRLFIHALKGSNDGYHHLCREEAKALRAWLKVRGTDPGPIFLSSRRLPISRQMLDVLMKDYGRLAGLPEKLRHMHVLKHSCGTHLMSKGYNVERVQDWLRLANIQNAMIYGKVTNTRRDEMARELRDSWR